MKESQNNQPQKIKVDWEIDDKLLKFVRAIKKLQQKDTLSESEYVSALLSFAISKMLNVDPSKK